MNDGSVDPERAKVPGDRIHESWHPAIVTDPRYRSPGIRPPVSAQGDTACGPRWDRSTPEHLKSGRWDAERMSVSPCKNKVPEVGLEPTRGLPSLDFESSASANSATPASRTDA